MQISRLKYCRKNEYQRGFTKQKLMLEQIDAMFFMIKSFKGNFSKTEIECLKQFRAPP